MLMTIGSDSELPFGKYKGRKAGEILVNDAEYMYWFLARYFESRRSGELSKPGGFASIGFKSDFRDLILKEAESSRRNGPDLLREYKRYKGQFSDDGSAPLEIIEDHSFKIKEYGAEWGAF